MNKLAQFFYRRLYWLVPWWYGTTQLLTRRRRHWPDVARYTSHRDIADAINWGRNWRPDPWNGRLDVMMNPRKFQARIDAGDEGFGDCDDHAIYWATALLKSKLCRRAWLGTIWYSKEDGSRASGHVVCVYETESGRRFWTDYGIGKPFDGEWGWVAQVAASRGKIPHAAGMFGVKLRRNGEPKLRKRVERRVF